jgi:hypothetical protein
MTASKNRQSSIHRYARLVLALFVLSIINMSIQIPAHAVMQQSMVSMPMLEMSAGMQMTHCKCPPAMCETVESFSDQSLDHASSTNLNHLLGFQAIYFNMIADMHQQPSVILFNYHQWQYRQYSPQPLIFNSILHI